MAYPQLLQSADPAVINELVSAQAKALEEESALRQQAQDMWNKAMAEAAFRTSNPRIVPGTAEETPEQEKQRLLNQLHPPEGWRPMEYKPVIEEAPTATPVFDPVTRTMLTPEKVGENLIVKGNYGDYVRNQQAGGKMSLANPFVNIDTPEQVIAEKLAPFFMGQMKTQTATPKVMNIGGAAATIGPGGSINWQYPPENPNATSKPIHVAPGSTIFNVDRSGKIISQTTAPGKTERPYVVETTLPDGTKVRQSKTKEEYDAYVEQQAMLPSADIQALLTDYNNTKKLITSGGEKFGPDWAINILPSRKSHLAKIGAEIKAAGFDPDTGKRLDTTGASVSLSGVTNIPPIKRWIFDENGNLVEATQ